MKRVIKRTLNNSGQKCKTYILEYKNSIIFYKLTLISKNKRRVPQHTFKNMFGGETAVKETSNYILTFHRFSIKRTKLVESLELLGIELPLNES